MAFASPRPSEITEPPSGTDAGDCVREEEVRFEARDGYVLSGVLYTSHRRPQPAVAAVFCTGGGVAASRYRHFLRHLASAGVPVLAYDYRGVARSAPTTRRGFDAGIEDWSELDQAAAIATLRSRFPAARVASIAHSIGCMVAAAAPNASLVSGLVFIAPHTGYWGDYRQPWRWPMALMWHVVMPLMAQLAGYFPASRIRVGDDFPRRVALQWGARVTGLYRLGAYGGNRGREYGLIDRMSALRARGLVISVEDDAFATDRAVRRFLMGLPGFGAVRREVAPAPGQKRCGHWGFFSRKQSAAWRIVTSFLLDKHDPPVLHPEWKVEDEVLQDEERVEMEHLTEPGNAAQDPR